MDQAVSRFNAEDKEVDLNIVKYLELRKTVSRHESMLCEILSTLSCLGFQTSEVVDYVSGQFKENGDRLNVTSQSVQTISSPETKVKQDKMVNGISDGLPTPEASVNTAEFISVRSQICRIPAAITKPKTVLDSLPPAKPVSWTPEDLSPAKRFVTASKSGTTTKSVTPDKTITPVNSVSPKKSISPKKTNGKKQNRKKTPEKPSGLIVNRRPKNPPVLTHELLTHRMPLMNNRQGLVPLPFLPHPSQVSALKEKLIFSVQPPSLPPTCCSTDASSFSFQAIVSWCVNPNDFYVIQKDLKEKLTKLEYQLNAYYKTDSMKVNKVLPLSEETFNLGIQQLLGSFWACIFSDDGKWYRARVVGGSTLEYAHVQYIDYGNTEQIKWNALYPLHPKFCELQACALHCSLEGVMPKDGDWTLDDATYLENALQCPAASGTSVSQLDQSMEAQAYLTVNVKRTSQINSYKNFEPEPKGWKECHSVEVIHPDAIQGETINILLAESGIVTYDVFESVKTAIASHQQLNRSCNSDMIDVEIPSPVFRPQGLPQEVIAEDDFFPETDEDLNRFAQARDSQEAAVGYSVSQDSRKCKYFGREGGCHKGNYCVFLHIDPEKQAEATALDDVIVDTSEYDPLILNEEYVIAIEEHLGHDICKIIFPVGVIPFKKIPKQELDAAEKGKRTADLDLYIKQSIEMTRTYSKMPPEKLDTYPAPGSLVAVCFRQEFSRGRVLDADEGKACVTVELLDLNEQVVFPRRMVYSLFGEFTVLSPRVRKVHIQPPPAESFNETLFRAKVVDPGSNDDIPTLKILNMKRIKNE